MRLDFIILYPFCIVIYYRPVTILQYSYYPSTVRSSSRRLVSTLRGVRVIGVETVSFRFHDVKKNTQNKCKKGQCPMTRTYKVHRHWVDIRRKSIRWPSITCSSIFGALAAACAWWQWCMSCRRRAIVFLVLKIRVRIPADYDMCCTVAWKSESVVCFIVPPHHHHPETEGQKLPFLMLLSFESLLVSLVCTARVLFVI